MRNEQDMLPDHDTGEVWTGDDLDDMTDAPIYLAYSPKHPVTRRLKIIQYWIERWWFKLRYL